MWVREGRGRGDQDGVVNVGEEDGDGGRERWGGWREAGASASYFVYLN